MNRSHEIRAVIFDMDGVVIDNQAYHIRAWQYIRKRRGFRIPAKRFNAFLPGRRNTDIVQLLLGRKPDPATLRRLANEKERLYRSLYAGRIRPLPGLRVFLQKLARMHMPCAIATSAPLPNIRLVFHETKLRRFFRTVTDEWQVTRGKPDPQIYRLTAKKLRIPSRNCLVFEDALAGVESAKRAGMQVIGVATSLPKRAFHGTVAVIRNFRDRRLIRLFFP